MGHRFYIVTGKGGVGKTTLSYSICENLIKKNRKVLYSSFDQAPDESALKLRNIPYINLHLDESAQAYVARKLGSEIIAKWILKTPFFHSLLEIVPGLGSMILLGNLIDLLEKDPDLTIVLDSPSSGHALTMIESPFNFKDMFISGLIVDDINRMLKLIQGEQNLNVLIATIPTEMSLEEAKELRTKFLKRNPHKVQIILNNSLEATQILTDHISELPSFYQKKIEIEKNIVDSHSQIIALSFPFYFQGQKPISSQMSEEPQIEELI